jgi:hypothetical protein
MRIFGPRPGCRMTPMTTAPYSRLGQRPSAPILSCSGDAAQTSEHRVFYVAKFEEGVYVLHAFEKKTRKTPKADLDVARSRLRELLSRRRPVTKTQE